MKKKNLDAVDCPTWPTGLLTSMQSSPGIVQQICLADRKNLDKQAVGIEYALMVTNRLVRGLVNKKIVFKRVRLIKSPGINRMTVSIIFMP